MTKRPTARCRCTPYGTAANIMILNGVMMFFILAASVVQVG